MCKLTESGALGSGEPARFSPYFPCEGEGREGSWGDAEKHAKAGFGNLLPEPV